MASGSEISAILGKYLLEGWTLTDVNCERPGCIGCPLMRSHDRSVQFCARCDGGPSSISLPLAGPSFPPPKTLPVSPSHSPSASSRPISPPTPPTPLSALAGVGTPTYDDELGFEPLGSPRTLNLRREQSDRAAQEIGNLLLKSWVMLDAQCPGDSCWGIPLMGSPRGAKLGEEKKGRWCVICRKDWDAAEVVQGVGPEAVTVERATTEEAAKVGVYSSPSTVPSSSRKRPAPAALTPPRALNPPKTAVQAGSAIASSAIASVEPGQKDILEVARAALAASVVSLSARLAFLSEATGDQVNQSAMANVAEALGKVVKVWKEVGEA